MQIRHSDPKEELIEVTNPLISSPQKTETPEDITGNIDGEELSEAEKRLQQEEKKYNLYQRVHVGQLSEGEQSDTDSDNLTYSYFS